jgi:hypothetical protein
MMPSDRAERRRLLSQAGVLVAGHLLLAMLLFVLVKPAKTAALPGVVIAIALTQSASIVGMCGALVVRRLYGEYLTARSRHLRGPIQQALAAIISDPAAHSRSLHLARQDPKEVEACLLDLFPLVRGSAHKALSALAQESGLVQRWLDALESRHARARRHAARCLALLSPEHCLDARSAMMANSDPEVRVEALRMLARSGEPAALSAALRLYSMMSRFHRALIADDLRPHAARLFEFSFEKVLNGADAGRILATLELPYCWKRTFRAPLVHALLDHTDAGVRAAALRVLPYETCGHQAADTVLALLGDADSRVREAAAQAAGKLRFAGSLGALAGGLGDGDAEVARSCAVALADLGPQGLHALEARIENGEGRAAAFAMEALEAARLGRAGAAV